MALLIATLWCAAVALRSQYRINMISIPLDLSRTPSGDLVVSSVYKPRLGTITFEFGSARLRPLIAPATEILHGRSTRTLSTPIPESEIAAAVDRFWLFDEDMHRIFPALSMEIGRFVRIVPWYSAILPVIELVTLSLLGGFAGDWVLRRLLAAWRAHRLRRLGPGVCPKCLYTSLPSATVCPECGFVRPPIAASN